jgi:hypothetical protein
MPFLKFLKKYLLKGLVMTFHKLSSYIKCSQNSSKINIAFLTSFFGLKLAAITWVSNLHFLTTLRFSSLTLVFIVACGQTGQNWVETFSPDLVKLAKNLGSLDALLDIFQYIF